MKPRMHGRTAAPASQPTDVRILYDDEAIYIGARLDDAGWTVEMRIPFSQLRFRRVSEQVWGLQLERVIGWRGCAGMGPRADPPSAPRSRPWPGNSRHRRRARHCLPDPEATETYGARYLFAPLDYTHLRADLRLNLTLTPRLSLETYVQPLIFALDFDEVGALAAPRTFVFEPWEGSLPDLDHTIRSLRGNAVLRWEWRPGSTLFLAWQQRRQDIGEDGHFGFRDDAGAVFSAPSDNILMVKATYWLNP